MTRTASDFITVAAGTKPTECTRCRDIVYWAQLPSGRWVMVDCSVPGGEEPSESKDRKQMSMFGGTQVRDGQGISHFIECPPPEGGR